VRPRSSDRKPYHTVLDSPFHYVPHSYFYVEDFEDNSLKHTRGQRGRGLAFGPSSSTDSVDGDDGHIDGSGAAGHSYWSFYFINGMTFTFKRGGTRESPDDGRHRVGPTWAR